MFKQLTFLFSLLFALSTLPSAFAVVDGVVVNHNDQGWRFTARLDLSFENGKIERCTGVLIHPRALLTAAHCLSNVASISVHFVEPTEGGTQFSTFSMKFEKHPDYTYHNNKSSKSASDYSSAQGSLARADDQGALLFLVDEHERLKELYLSRFNSPLSYFENYDKIIVANRRADLGVIILDEEVPEPFASLTLIKGPANEHLPYGAELHSYGYGLHKLNTHSSDKILRSTDLNLISFIKTKNQPSNLVVFSMNRPGLIFGDSGGPVVLNKEGRLYLIGINSATGIDGHSVLSIPQFHLPWIVETLEAYLQTQVQL